MAGFKAAEIPTLHRAGESTADGDAGDVHLLAGDEMVRLKLVTHFEHARIVHPELCHLAAGLDLGLGELPAQGFAGVLGLGEAGAQGHGGIAVFFLGTGTDDGAAVEFQNRDRDMSAVCQKQTGHTDLLRDDACAHLTLLTT